MNTSDTNRQAFEDACWAYYQRLKALGWSAPEEGDSTLRESLFWRKPNSMYGVQQIEAAWCGWCMHHRASEARPAEPIDMVLHCPACGMQHVDAEEPPVMPDGMFEGDEGWDNPPHRSHLCHGCGHIWRPADVPTNGVAAVQTKGKADSPIAQPKPVAAPAPDPNNPGWCIGCNPDNCEGCGNGLPAQAPAVVDGLIGGEDREVIRQKLRTLDVTMGGDGESVLSEVIDAATRCLSQQAPAPEPAAVQAPAVKADTDKIAAYLRWIMRTVNNFEAKTGKGGWFAEEMQEACNAIAKETGTPVKFGISSYSAGYEHPTGDNPFPSGAPVATLTITVEGSTTTIDCDWGDVIRSLPPGSYPLRFSQPPVQGSDRG